MTLVRTLPVLLATLLASHIASAADVNCHAGAYRLDDGALVDVAPVSEPNQLRWRLIDGRTGLLTADADGQWSSTLGWTGRPDGVRVRFGDCTSGRISFDGHNGSKLVFDIVPTTFQGNGVTLRGRLVLPQGSGPVPVTVAVHGSEHYSGVDRYHLQNLLPANGIGVFVYDKRGTGGSSGKYTQDFALLSDDAKAALDEARRLAGKRAGRMGFFGGSQGGWVAPLAASKASGVDFVAVGYGLAESPLAEDREQVMLDLRTAGYGDDVLSKAREVTDATGVIVATRGARGWEQMDVVRAKYGREPWWTAMKGEFTGLVAQHTRVELAKLQQEMELGTSWDYDPMPVLRSLSTPQLWMLGADDREAPPEETRKRLVALAGEGRPISAVVFPGTDHGIIEFDTDAQGERHSTRIADGYFRMQIEWIKTGRLAHAPYGNAQILATPKAPVAAR
ncbi:alpha/beta hydrolase family protein [Lysobacter cavernae]|uniref:Alpha/beta hydrolase family protein n=1 Tax=Lysobacter cavernae TaxID=1685901 RepID=A0ABV7RLA7_9GAMM